MIDSVEARVRSQIMARVRSTNTRPELAVRRLVFHAGYRYRLHVRSLPGSPDLVFEGRRKVIFVHGCFWHQHPGCPQCRMPKSRLEFWTEKLSRNKHRDALATSALETAGWRVLTVWECETADAKKLLKKISEFLEE